MLRTGCHIGSNIRGLRRLKMMIMMVIQIELNHNFQGASKMENEWTFLIRNLKPATPYEVVMTKSIIVIPSEMTIIMMIMLIIMIR